jgi:probable rRNA maturation factor
MVIFEPAISGASTHSVSAVQLQRFVRRAQLFSKVKGEVNILISNNQRLRDLNRRFRSKNKPTDVLSFSHPAGGDIAISGQIARQNAARYGHALADELKILVLHGMLHLAGYDHESDNGRMRRAEARLRARLKLPASLIDRTHSRGQSARTKQRTVTATKRAKPSGKLTTATRRTGAAARGSRQ